MLSVKGRQVGIENANKLIFAGVKCEMNEKKVMEQNSLGVGGFHRLVGDDGGDGG